MNIKPGDIWQADLGLTAKTRPVLLVSRYDPEAPRALITYVPLTTQIRGGRYEVSAGHLPFLQQPSVVNVQARDRVSDRTTFGTQVRRAFP